MTPTPIVHRKNCFQPILLTCVLAGMCFTSVSALGQSREEGEVRASMAVLNEIMAIPAQRIPKGMLAGAEGVAIIPNVIKGGFVVGARRGRGTLLIRDQNRNWHAPVFISLTGGSIGWQAGIQSTDVILVFRTQKSVQGILSGKFTLGVDAAAAAGPVGRQASAGTDLRLKAEVYSYARSRGVFLGASFDGSMLQVDGMANASYYHPAGPGVSATIPPSAMQLAQLVTRYSGGGVPAAQQVAARAAPATPRPAPATPRPTQATATIGSSAGSPVPAPRTPVLAHQYSTHESDVIRDQLGKTSPELFERIAPAWQSYLALPAEVFSRRGHPSAESIQKSLRHYEQVRENPQYQALATTPEFQSTYGLLKHYSSTLGGGKQPLLLPPPPVPQ